jgi:site-specific DNA recombinase
VKVFGYVRLSKLDQDTTSPQRQRKAIADLCTARGASLVETFEDLDLSAYNKRVRRPGYDSMLARPSEVNAVVSWRLDRLVRTMTGFAKMLYRLEAAGCTACPALLPERRG